MSPAAEDSHTLSAGHFYMSDAKSLLNLADLRQKIAAAPTDKQAENFLRNFIRESPSTMPLHYLLPVMTLICDLRSAELARDASSN